MERRVEVLAGPGAADVSRAWQELVELRRMERHRQLDRLPSDALTDLYRQLLDRYPPFEEDPSTPWGDGPMALYFGDRLATVLLVEPRVAEALPVVIAIAKGCNMTVFDVTGERIHRPDGEQPLPTSLTEHDPWRDPLDEPASDRAWPPPAPRVPVEPSKQERRTTLAMTGGCGLILLALAALWTAVMLALGWATSLGSGDGDTPWVKQDVPLLTMIAAGALLTGVLLLFVGARRARLARSR